MKKLDDDLSHFAKLIGARNEADEAERPNGPHALVAAIAVTAIGWAVLVAVIGMGGV